jgi:hypothetical protein
VFGDGSFVALDYDGRIVWLNREQQFYSQHGLGTSPIFYGGWLLMARDGSSEGDDKTLGWQKPWDKGVLLALDAETGKIRWKGSRGQSRIAHVVPNVLHAGDGVQIVSGAGDVVQGFDPDGSDGHLDHWQRGEPQLGRETRRPSRLAAGILRPVGEADHARSLAAAGPSLQYHTQGTAITHRSPRGDPAF